MCFTSLYSAALLNGWRCVGKFSTSAPETGWQQVSGSSCKLSFFQCSKSSWLSVGSWLSGWTLSGLWARSGPAGSWGGWIWFCVSAALFCFLLCTTVLSWLSLTILQRRIHLLTTCCTSSSTFHWQILHHWLLSGRSSAAQSSFRLHVVDLSTSSQISGGEQRLDVCNHRSLKDRHVRIWWVAMTDCQRLVESEQQWASPRFFSAGGCSSSWEETFYFRLKAYGAEGGASFSNSLMICWTVTPLSPILKR